MKTLPIGHLIGQQRTMGGARPFALIPFLLLFFATVALYAQDRNIQKNEVYPPEMFIENGGRYINVQTSLTFLGIGPNAKGNGVDDDSDEIIAAIDYIVDKLRVYYANGGGCQYNEYFPIYLPNGTYRVTKTLAYTGERLVHCVASQQNDPKREGLQKLMFIGQSREGTIVKLDDNANGFGAGDNRPVMTFSSVDRGIIFNNAVANFQFSNITINTGSGNPGAIALDFLGANNARLENAKFVGSGKIGLHYRIGSAHGYSSNIIVDGFDYGIYMEGNTESHPAIEYVTLKNQDVNAIYLEDISASLRNILSENSVTGVRIKTSSTGRLPHMTIVDSEFNNGSSSNTVFQLEDGFLFARNIAVSGYGTSVKKGNSTVASGAITEYISEPIDTFSSSRVRSGAIKSMNLPIEDWPIIPWETNLSNWANVQSFGAAGNGSTDDTQAIQDAMNSGKPVIYFPKRRYRINGTVSIPASIKQVMGSKTVFVGGNTFFDINQGSSTPLFIESMRLEGGDLLHSVNRTLLAYNVAFRNSGYVTNFSSPGTKVFMNNVNGVAGEEDEIKNIDIWIRGTNNEKVGNFQFTAGANTHMWMMGFKSEKTYTVFHAKEGAFFEVLGGVMNSYGSASPNLEPVVLNDNSHVSIVVASNGPDRGWDPIILDNQGGTTKTWDRGDLPYRGWGNNFIVPLYASYDPSLVSSAPPMATDTVGALRSPAAPVIDGNLGEYALDTSLSRTVCDSTDNSATFSTQWDTTYFYVGVRVQDTDLQNDSKNWKDDGIEVYIDADHNKGSTYDSFDRQFVLGWGDTAITEQNGNTTGVLFAQSNITGGYTMELAIPWSNLGVTPAEGLVMGFDVGVNDDDNGGGRDGQLMWVGTANNFKDTSAFGDVTLMGDTTPPSVPTGLSADNVTETALDLSWTASTDNVGVTGYEVFQDGISIGITSTTSLAVSGLTAGTAYSFTVTASDAAGNTSAASDALNVTTQSGGGGQPGVLEAERSSAMTVDGALNEPVWSLVQQVAKTTSGTPDNTVDFDVVWDDTYLYVGAKVTDGDLFNDSPEDWKDDGIEIYIDGDHNAGSTYDSFDRQYIKGYNTTTLFEKNGNTGGVLHATAAITGGYAIELAIPWSNLGITPLANLTIGFDIGDNDDDNGGGRDGQSVWVGTSDNFKDTSAFGDVVLKVSPSGPTSITLEAEEATLSQAIVESNHAGYTGSGFANYDNVTGSYVEWQVNVATAGSYELSFRYANGSTADRPCAIRVNGTLTDPALAFGPTGAWTSYGYTSEVTVSLSAGQNTVRATANLSTGGANMDHLKVTGGGTALRATIAPQSETADTEQVLYYPNPVDDILTIALPPSRAGATEARFHAMDGRLLLSAPLGSSGEVDLSALPPGTYQMEVGDRARPFRAKVIKR